MTGFQHALYELILFPELRSQAHSALRARTAPDLWSLRWIPGEYAEDDGKGAERVCTRMDPAEDDSS